MVNLLSLRIRSQFCKIGQCLGTWVKKILEPNGSFRELSGIVGDRKPMTFEYDKLTRTLTDFVGIYFGGRLGANNCRLARSNEYRKGYNSYGRLVTKRKKGCSNYYALLNVNATSSYMYL